MIGMLKHLVHFGHAVEAGSITAAAGKLEVSPSVISTSVKIVEAQMGQTLLERRKSGVRLNPGAESIYTEARAIMSALDRLAQMRGQGRALSGPVRVSLPVEVSCGWLTEAMIGLQRAAPDIELILSPEDRVVDHMKFSRDLHIRIERAPQVEGLNVLHRSEVTTVLAVRSDVLAGRDPEAPATWADLTLLATPGTSRDGYQVADGGRVRFGTFVWVDAIQGRIDLARQGVGAVACLRPTFAADFDRGTMTELAASCFPRPVQVIIGSPHKQPNRAVRHVAGAFAAALG